MNSYVTINTQAVRAIIRDQNLKVWWVAEFAGVHKTTLRRWLSGRIQRVHTRRAEQLARVLVVEPTAILKR